MKPASIQLVVLDMAGTTVEDGGMVVDAMRRTIAELAPGLDIDEEALAANRGRAKIDLFRAIVPQRADEALVSFTAGLRQAVAEGAVSEIPGATDALGRLRASGASVALTTGFDRVLADDMVRHLGWDSLVDAVVGGDEVAAGRPAPDLVLAAADRCGIDDKKRIAVCGDTVHDVGAGVASGAGVVVAVGTGDEPPQPSDLPAGVHLLDSVADLPGLLGI